LTSIIWTSPPPRRHDDPIITQFKPRDNQWELNDKNIKRIDPETGHTILHNYCRHINTTPLEGYQYLIETHGCDVNAQDNDSETALHRAIRYFKPLDSREINVLVYLINQKDVNINIKGKKGGILLHLACICDLSDSNHGVRLNAKCDTILCQIVELITERCLQRVLDEKTP
jgi:ankyrin repeat protein